MAKRVADIVVETLQAAGVKHCWGVPGDIRCSDIEWVHVRHEEVAGFAAGAEAMLTGDLTACAGSCGPGSLHFINGLFESRRNRAPVVLIASQITSDEQGFDFPQEVDFAPIYKSCSVFCDEIRTPAQARRKTAMAAQAALSKRGVAVLILPIDVSKAPAPDEPAFAVHVSQPVIHPGDECFVGGIEANKHENKKLKAGRGTVGKTAVLGMRERGGRTVAAPIANTDAETVQTEIHRHVETGSTLHTDEAGAYAGIGGMFFDHDTVNHSEGEFVRDTVTTNGIESVFAVLKRGLIGVYHHASKKHLGRYVDEFSFRLNEGNVKHHTLARLGSLVCAGAGKRLTYADLIA